MRPHVAVLALFVALALVSAADSTVAADTDVDIAPCLNGLGPALLADGFSGSLDCQDDQLSARYVGPVRAAGHTFEVYSYRYRLKPVCPECAIHGGQRILLMEGGRYVGQYRADFAQVTTKRGDLVFISASGGSVTVEFSRDGPPKQLWFDGEVLSFFR